MRLTEEKFWDRVYEIKKNKDFSFFKKVKIFFKGWLGDKLLNYSEYLLWNKIYPQFLPHQENIKILELGSAPGRNLINFYKKFGYEPYGVDFSGVGINKQRHLFKKNGLDPNNVILSDFLENNFQEKYKEFFDIVMSGGVIEHFTELGDIIDCHLNLLKRGGMIIVSVPNLNGMNRLLARFFFKDIFKHHNELILDRNNLNNVLSRKTDMVFCNYFGSFNFGLFMVGDNLFKKIMHKLSLYFQFFLNLFLSLVFRKNSPESRYFSPYIMYIGIKK